MSSETSYFHLYQDHQSMWRWSFHAKNGRTIAVSSEGYVDQDDCLKSIGLILAHASLAIPVFK